MSVPDLLVRSARSMDVNVALMRAFRRSPMDFLDVLVASGAGTVPLRMGPERVLLVDDAAQVWELLTKHARRTGKGRGLVRARLLLGEGLLTSEGEEHLRHRRALQPAFHSQRIADYLAHFAGAARRAAERWSDGGDIDLVAEMSAMTLDGAGTALFGSDLREPAPQITRALTNLLAGFRLAMAPGGPTLLRSPLPVAIRVRSAKAELENVVDDLIRGRWAGEPPPGPVLDLLAAQPELTDREVRDEVMTLLLAGHETTAMALTWALAAIDQAPAVRADLEAEWDAKPEALPAGELAGRAAADHGRTRRDATAVAAVVDVQPPRPRAGGARWAHRAGGDDVPGQPGFAASRPAVVGRARTVPARPLAAARAGEGRPLRPQGARPTARRLPALRCRTQDVYRGAVRLVGGRDDAGRAGPHLAPPRARRSAGRRPILNDVAAERPVRATTSHRTS